MKLTYKNKEVDLTQTHNELIMQYKFPKLRNAIIIYDCNTYSSILSKQRVDIALVDDKLNIITYRYSMHENTILKDEKAKHTILIPLNTFNNLEENTRFTLKD